MNTPLGKIRLLPDIVSSQIAAGEVIERPGAVIKELLDNSLDAGSTIISVDVEEGGRRLLRVTDNGEGMNADDAALACQRFATSKLISESQLSEIRTLGFRGEALPSIASVSKLRLLTKRPDDLVGMEMQADGARDWRSRERSAPSGTTVEVKDLFFNTPARLKFLKTVGTEFSKICLVVQQAALAWPLVHLRLRHGTHSVFDFPSVTNRTDRLLQVYGTRFMDTMSSIDHRQDGLHVEGVSSSPYHVRSSRTPQELFVNGRAIKNTTIVHAAYEAYGSFLPKGTHPKFVLFLDVPRSVVDINVHPTKREVRFSHPELIHRVVKAALRETLKTETVLHTGIAPAEPAQRDTSNTAASFEPSASSSVPGFSAPPLASDMETMQSLFSVEPTSRSTVAEAQPGQVHETHPLYPARPHDPDVLTLGQVNRTYLVAQVDGELQIVDQHTAHERVLFERLWAEKEAGDIRTQPLLIPEPIELPPEHAPLLREHLPDLAALGLDVEEFGERTFVIRAVPALMGAASYGPLLHQILEELAEWQSHDTLDAKVRSVLASVACQSAVQAGRAMTEPEITKLLIDWARVGHPMTCPHGRRVAMRFSAQELDKIFGRT